MKSMTGFGYAELSNELCQISVEFKGYNNRYLDLSINLPSSLSALEPRIRDILRDRVGRGRVELSCRLRETESQGQLILDLELARKYVGALRQLAEISDSNDPVNLSDLLKMEGIIQLDRRREPEQYWPLLSEAIDRAFAQFDAARTQEGSATVADIQAQLARIRQGLGTLEEQASLIESNIKDNLRSKFVEVMGNMVDENRVLAELAASIVKYSINEEISRLHTHVKSFEETLGAGEAAGKLLDFLSQELNREINTVGSKSFLIPVTQAVVSMKDALENIREQLRNLE